MDLMGLTDCGRFHGGGRGSPRASTFSFTACDPCTPPRTATGGHGRPCTAVTGLRFCLSFCNDKSGMKEYLPNAFFTILSSAF